MCVFQWNLCQLCRANRFLLSVDLSRPFMLVKWIELRDTFKRISKRNSVFTIQLLTMSLLIAQMGIHFNSKLVLKYEQKKVVFGLLTIELYLKSFSILYSVSLSTCILICAVVNVYWCDYRFFSKPLCDQQSAFRDLICQ